MKKRILSGAAALAIVLTMAAAPVFAENAPIKTVAGIELPIIDPTADTWSGKCGENVNWRLADGTLTITGTGVMYDYSTTQNGDKAPWYDQRTKVKHVKVESGVTSVGGAAFQDCVNLEDFTAADGLVSVGAGAFMNCTNLTSAALPDSVTSIGENAFYGCEQLKGFTIPAGVTSIGGHAFYDCAGLKTVVIPAGVTVIPASAFKNCSKLESVTIPDGVTTIGDSAFLKCSKLKKVTVPASVTTIGDSALGFTKASSTSPQKLEGFVIAGYSGSAAETYANANGFTFEKLDAAEVIKGDANRDTFVTQEDLAEVQKWVAGWSVDIDMAASDVTGDNRVDGEDISLLQQRFAGWNVTFK